jgi:hypothetical protein
MGAQQSKQKVTINTSQTLSDTATFLQSNSVKISSTNNNYQYLKASFVGAKISGSTIQQLQSISATNQITGTLNVNSLNQLSEQLKSDLQAATTQAATNKPGYLGLGAQDTNFASTVNNAMKTAINRTMEQKSYQNIANRVFNVQTGELNFDGTTIENTTVTQSQTIVSNLIATAIVNSIINETNNVLTYQNSNVVVSQTSTNAPTGPLQDLASFASSKGGITSSIVCCAVCCLLIILVGFVWKNGGQDVALKAVNKMPPVIP